MNTRQTKFVAAVLKGKSLKAAYLAAGYKARGKAIEVNAARLRANPEVAAAIDQAQKKVVEKAITAAEISTTRVLELLVEELETNCEKPRDRLKAIEMLGNHTGAWTPKPPAPPCPLDLDSLTDEAKRGLLNALRAARVQDNAVN